MLGYSKKDMLNHKIAKKTFNEPYSSIYNLFLQELVINFVKYIWIGLENLH